MPTHEGPAGVAPGWYEDPKGQHQQRYWDGSSWTEHVVDGGLTSIDPLDDSQATSADERELLVVQMATDVAKGGYMNLYLTDRRLVVEKLMGSTGGAYLAGGALGGAIADSVARKRSDSAVTQGSRPDEILAASKKNYAIDYATITQVRLKRNAMPVGHSRCKIASTQKNVTLAFKREAFDEVVSVMRQVLGDSVGVK